MRVIATAGHVDHGKSTLVHALTGTDPDRLAEEHRRGLTIELGYCWTTLPGIGEVAFVDVPGHERFVSTMLSGVGPVPAVLFVVAADDPWMPQAAEHLAALDALGVAHGVLAVTRADLADPGPAMEQASAAMSGTTLEGMPMVVVSGKTGLGLDALRSALASMVAGLPTPDPGADVRFWVDRRFHVQGAGAVVTGTLSAGTIRRGDVLACGDHLVRVRGLQTLTRDTDQVSGVARAAMNLSGAPDHLGRGGVLLTPQRWWHTPLLDVRLSTPDATALPERPLLHLGATSVGAHMRPLADDLVRVRIAEPLPLRVGDRALLRDPGSRRIWGVTVLDPAPPPLDRRGAARARAKELASSSGEPSVRDELRRRGTAEVSMLRRIGVDPAPGESPGDVVRAGRWLLDPDRVPGLIARLRDLVAEHATTVPVDPGLPVTVVARELDLPTVDLVPLLVTEPLVLVDGAVRHRDAPSLTPDLLAALRALENDLADNPFAAPDADRLVRLGLDGPALGAASRAGRVLRLGNGVVLLPGADTAAIDVLGRLPQPFTVSEARRALGTTRRVALPLLALLDRTGRTRRLPDDRRTVSR